MDKIIIFNNDEDGTIESVIRVKNWDENFNKVVAEAKEEWSNSTDALFQILEPKLEAAGYGIELPDYEELLV